MEIKWENVTIGYGKKIILKNINLHLKNKEQVFILGKSGAGKSTLFNALIDPRLILKGKILVNQMDISLFKRHALRKWRQKLAILNQETLLLEDQSVYDNLKLFYPNYKRGWKSIFHILTKKQKQELLLVIKKIGLMDYLFTRVSDLSGGQKRRVELALIFLKKTALILADEPTNGLDIKNSQNILLFLKNMRQSTLINVHHLALLDQPHMRLVGIANQKIAFDCKLSQLSQEKIKKLYA